MVQFKILTGKLAGKIQTSEQFPLTIGRSPSSSLRLEDAGVWDTHLQIQLDDSGSFVLHLQPNAIATVNGQTFEAVVLRNGDLIELGSAKIQFWLSETRQSSLKTREALTWIAIVLLTLIQAGFILWLLQ